MKLKPETRLVASIKNVQTVHGPNHSSFRVEWQVAENMQMIAPITWCVFDTNTVEGLADGLEEAAAKLRALAGIDEDILWADEAGNEPAEPSPRQAEITLRNEIWREVYVKLVTAPSAAVPSIVVRRAAELADEAISIPRLNKFDK